MCRGQRTNFWESVPSHHVGSRDSNSGSQAGSQGPLPTRSLCSCPGHPHTASATPPGPCRASKHIHGNNHTHSNHDSDLAWSTPHPMFLVKRRGKQGHIGRGLPALHCHWSSASYHDFDVSALFHQIWSKHVPCCFCVEPGLSFTFFIEAGLSACRLLCLHLNWAPLGI